MALLTNEIKRKNYI